MVGAVQYMPACKDIQLMDIMNIVWLSR